jgi:CBS domain-containing protein
MIKVRDIMTTNPITVAPETEILQATKIILEKDINGLPVLDGEKLVGIICQSDLIVQQKKFPIPSLFTLLDGIFPLTSMKHIEKETKKIAATTVAQAMTTDPLTIEPEMTIEEVATIMVNKKFHTLPVVEGGKLVGVVGKKDILETLISNKKKKRTAQV